VGREGPPGPRRRVRVAGRPHVVRHRKTRRRRGSCRGQCRTPSGSNNNRQQPLAGAAAERRGKVPRRLHQGAGAAASASTADIRRNLSRSGGGGVVVDPSAAAQEEEGSVVVVRSSAAAAEAEGRGGPPGGVPAGGVRRPDVAPEGRGHARAVVLAAAVPVLLPAALGPRRGAVVLLRDEPRVRVARRAPPARGRDGAGGSAGSSSPCRPPRRRRNAVRDGGRLGGGNPVPGRPLVRLAVLPVLPLDAAAAAGRDGPRSAVPPGVCLPSRRGGALLLPLVGGAADGHGRAGLRGISGGSSRYEPSMVFIRACSVLKQRSAHFYFLLRLVDRGPQQGRRNRSGSRRQGRGRAASSRPSPPRSERKRRARESRPARRRRGTPPPCLPRRRRQRPSPRPAFRRLLLGHRPPRGDPSPSARAPCAPRPVRELAWRIAAAAAALLLRLRRLPPSSGREARRATGSPQSR
jgi:hypothetical protein